jgi:hypothetical protein
MYVSSIYSYYIYIASNEETIRKHFEAEVGDIEYVRIIRDPKYKVCKGFGYIKFTVSSVLSCDINSLVCSCVLKYLLLFEVMCLTRANYGSYRLKII